MTDSDDLPVVIDVSTEQSAALADLTSVARDLEDTKAYVRQLQAMPASTHPGEDQDVLRHALWQSVAITYRRAFSGGASFAKGRSRTRFPQAIVDNLSESDQHTHNAIIDEANRHIAHRVSNDREQGEVKVLLDRSGNVGVLRSNARSGGAREDLVLAVDPLCNRLIAELDHQIDALTELIREAAEAELE